MMGFWELAGCFVAFQVLQAVVAGALIALLLLCERLSRARQGQRGDPA